MPQVTAISSLGWAHYTLYEALPRIRDRGFTRVELASFTQYCFHFNFGSPTPSELKGTLANLGLTPICLNYSPGCYDAWRRDDIDRFVADNAKKLAQLSEAGIPMMTMTLGERNERPDQDAQLANTVEAYDRVAAVAAPLGIRMLLEIPHLYTIMPRVEQALWVIERLSSPNIGVLVDSSHWGIIGYDADAYFGALGDRLWHVHLRDSTGRDTADRKQQLELTPGSGSADFRTFGEALDRANYAHDVSLEFEYRDRTLEEIEHEYDVGLRHLKAEGWQLPASVRL